MPGWNKVIRVFISHTTLRDILMLINMVLLLIIGTVLLVRNFLAHGSFLAYAMGCGLMLAALYRGYLVYQVLTRIRVSLGEEIEGGSHRLESFR